MHNQAVKALIQTALNEDIGSGDITTDNLIAPDLAGRGVLIAKEPLVLAGMDIARQVFHHLDTSIEMETLLSDGDTAAKGDTLANIQGNLADLLKGERTALSNQLRGLLAEFGITCVFRLDTNDLENHLKRQSNLL